MLSNSMRSHRQQYNTRPGLTRALLTQFECVTVNSPGHELCWRSLSVSQWIVLSGSWHLRCDNEKRNPNNLTDVVLLKSMGVTKVVPHHSKGTLRPFPRTFSSVFCLSDTCWVFIVVFHWLLCSALRVYPVSETLCRYRHIIRFQWHVTRRRSCT